MRIESPQIKDFINGRFVGPVPFLVIPGEVEEWSEWDERHRRLRREGSGERVGRRTSQSLDVKMTQLSPTPINKALQSTAPTTAIQVQGWVRTRRDSKDFSFVELNDGSSLRH